MNASFREELVIGARKEKGKSLVGLYAASVFVWALDFKAQNSGGAAAFQAVLLLTYTLLYFWITVTAAGRGATIGSVWWLIIAATVFMVDACVVGLSESQDTYAVFVNLIPPLIYISAAALTYITLAASEDDLPAFLNVLRLACLAFGVERVLVVYLSPGSLDPTTSRWGVISGAVVPSLGIIAVALINRLTKLDVLVLMFNLIVTLLSVTRTLFIALIVQMGCVFIARPTAMFRSTTIKGVLLSAISIGAIVGLDYAADWGLVGRWIDRLTISERAGADPTALTRSAEVHFMLEAFESTPATILFGNGIAAVTSLTGPDAQRAAKLVGWGSVNIHSIGYGHESYVSILYVAGLVGGGALLFVQFLNGFQAIALLRRVQLDQLTLGESASHIGSWGSFIVLGMLATSFLGGMFADRSQCIWYGIGTGMLYWSRAVPIVPKETVVNPGNPPGLL